MLKEGEREYDIVLHITVTRQDGSEVTFRDHAYSIGRNAGEAAERAIRAQMKVLPRAKVEAGGAKWLKS